MSERVVQARRKKKAAETSAMLQHQAPMLIVFGRFIPGVRFVVGATMCVTRFPYHRFVLWNVIGEINGPHSPASRQHLS
jgi:membrane protein DedA with SNARE-associated domain